MDNQTIQIKRDELYEKVWQTPISRLASDYGISGVGMKKICKKLNVPTPPRGYWARLQNGYKVSRIPLPKIKTGEIDTYVLTQKSADENILLNEIDEQDYLPEGIDLSIPVKVNKTLYNPHPVVKEIKALIDKVTPDDYGVVQPLEKKFLGFRVSPNNLSRALRIFDCIIKWFESKGFRYTINEGGYREAYFTIYDEKMEFAINENSVRKDHVPTKKELEENAKWSYYTFPKWDYTPSGKLSLTINTWGGKGIKKKWTDTATKSIEDQINSFISNIFQIAYLKKQESLRREEEKRRWMLEQERLEEEKKRREIEKQKLMALENQAAQWEKSKQLRNFIDEVEKRASKMSLSIEKTEQIKQWLMWAREHADNLDPLHEETLPTL